MQMELFTSRSGEPDGFTRLTEGCGSLCMISGGLSAG